MLFVLVFLYVKYLVVCIFILANLCLFISYSVDCLYYLYCSVFALVISFFHVFSCFVTLSYFPLRYTPCINYVTYKVFYCCCYHYYYLHSIFFFSKSNICTVWHPQTSCQQTEQDQVDVVLTRPSFCCSHFLSTKTADTLTFSKMVLFHRKNKTHLQSRVWRKSNECVWSKTLCARWHFAFVSHSLEGQETAWEAAVTRNVL